jgi:hypothetical protein
MNNSLINKAKEKYKREGLYKLICTILSFNFLITIKNTKKMLKLDNNKDRFNLIYEKNFWASKESVSGEGSEVEYTQNLRKWLPDKITKYNIKNVVDAPCGDFNWMKLVLPKVNINYFGFDIVKGLIDKNKKFYSTNNIKFGVADICSDELPTCDLLIVRDCLFHLSYKDINRFLVNTSNLEYKFLLTTTHITKNDFSNTDINTGEFRLINLFKSPFCFDENSVIERVNDFPEGHDPERELIMIKKNHMPISIKC